MGDKKNKQKKEYLATYKFGKTVVKIVAPPPMTEEENQRRIQDFYNALWDIWDSLSVEEQLKLNAEIEEEKRLENMRKSHEVK
ncbi:hypothetical protein ACSVDA_23955 [Cytobacillus sp. Hm23]